MYAFDIVFSLIYSKLKTQVSVIRLLKSLFNVI